MYYLRDCKEEQTALTQLTAPYGSLRRRSKAKYRQIDLDTGLSGNGKVARLPTVFGGFRGGQ
jgi:hypothetical protein